MLDSAGKDSRKATVNNMVLGLAYADTFGHASCLLEAELQTIHSYNIGNTVSCQAYVGFTVPFLARCIDNYVQVLLRIVCGNVRRAYNETGHILSALLADSIASVIA